MSTADPPGKGMEQRKDPRFRTRFDALISAGAMEGAGILADISYSGARLDDASHTPPVGASVRLYVFVHPVMPFEIEGQVVRATESGFAIRYEVADAEVRRLVDDVAAIVSSP